MGYTGNTRSSQQPFNSIALTQALTEASLADCSVSPGNHQALRNSRESKVKWADCTGNQVVLASRHNLGGACYVVRVACFASGHASSAPLERSGYAPYSEGRTNSGRSPSSRNTYHATRKQSANDALMLSGQNGCILSLSRFGALFTDNFYGNRFSHSYQSTQRRPGTERRDAGSPGILEKRG
jgi:hypothetical protein